MQWARQAADAFSSSTVSPRPWSSRPWFTNTRTNCFIARTTDPFDLLQTLNTGHSGSLSTIHANSADQALARFASCVLQSGVELPYQAIRRLISESIDLVLHVERRRGIRSVTQIVCVTGYDPTRDIYDLEAPVVSTGDGDVGR